MLFQCTFGAELFCSVRYVDTLYVNVSVSTVEHNNKQQTTTNMNVRSVVQPKAYVEIEKNAVQQRERRQYVQMTTLVFSIALM